MISTGVAYFYYSSFSYSLFPAENIIYSFNSGDASVLGRPTGSSAHLHPAEADAEAGWAGLHLIQGPSGPISPFPPLDVGVERGKGPCHDPPAPQLPQSAPAEPLVAAFNAFNDTPAKYFYQYSTFFGQLMINSEYVIYDLD